MLRSILVGVLVLLAFQVSADHAAQPLCIGQSQIIEDVKSGVLNMMHSLNPPAEHWRAVGRLEGLAAKAYATKQESPHATAEYDTLITFDTEGKWFAFVMFHEGCYVAHGVHTKWGNE
jgi:hypothetical protein